MAFAKERTKKDGTKFYEISAYYCGNDEEKKKKAPRRYTKYYYPPFGWSARSIKKALNDEIAEFQRAVDAGEVLSKAEKKEKEEREKAEAAAAAVQKALLKTVKQYAEKVFMPKKEQSITENTRLSYWSNLNGHIFPAFGDVLIKDVTTAMINAMLLEFQKTHSYGSSVKVYNICNGLFGMAFRDGTIDENPMFKVERPAQKKDEKAVSEADKALFEDELLYVLDCVQNEPIKWQAFMYLAADTGMRRGEMCGLQWSDIDLKNGLVKVKRNLQYSTAMKMDSNTDKTVTVVYDGVYYVTPKGGKFRTVDIGEDTINILKAYKAALTKSDEEETETEDQTEDGAVVNFAEYKQKKEEDQKKKLPKWLFTVDGEDLPMFPHSPTRYFTNFGERYNLPGFHPHLLRHTSATLSLTNGGDTKSVADRLGHKDASILLKVYAHANDDSVRAAGQAARDALKRKKEEAKKKAEKENAGA